ncbi:MAG: hypothetical protein ACR2H9_09710 [Longimicrobiaceae bacterium]|jgi:hypothetical protein
MEGVRYLVDESGEKRAVVIDLDQHGELWEDFYDVLVARARQDEPRETLAEVKERLASRAGPARDG